MRILLLRLIIFVYSFFAVVIVDVFLVACMCCVHAVCYTARPSAHIVATVISCSVKNSGINSNTHTNKQMHVQINALH